MSSHLRALELLRRGVACKDPNKMRDPLTGLCRRQPSQRFSMHPEKYQLVRGHWVLKNKPEPVYIQHDCAKGQRWSEGKGCYNVAAYARKPRTKCKYGFDEVAQHCNPRPRSQRGLDPKYVAVPIVDSLGRRRIVYRLANPKQAKKVQLF